jgi:hypothetical protein
MFAVFRCCGWLQHQRTALRLRQGYGETRAGRPYQQEVYSWAFVWLRGLVCVLLYRGWIWYEVGAR